MAHPWVAGTISTDSQKRHSVKGIILREKDLIQSNNDIKNTNTPSEHGKKKMNGAKIPQGVKTYT